MGEIHNAINKFHEHRVHGQVTVNNLNSPVQILYSPGELEIRNLIDSFSAIKFLEYEAEQHQIKIRDNEGRWISPDVDDGLNELQIYRLLDPRLLLPKMTITDTRRDEKRLNDKDFELDTITASFDVKALSLPLEVGKFFDDHNITKRDVLFYVITSTYDSNLVEMFQKDLPPFEDSVGVKFQFLQQ